jgi:hypothetical protein
MWVGGPCDRLRMLMVEVDETAEIMSRSSSTCESLDMLPAAATDLPDDWMDIEDSSYTAITSRRSAAHILRKPTPKFALGRA